MQAIIIIDNGKTTVALCATHDKKVHRLIIHPHQNINTRSLIRLQKCTMRRLYGSKTSIEQIKETSLIIIFCIRIETEKTGKAHQKYQMKIGKPMLTSIQPTNRMLQISKKRPVLRLLTQCPIKKLGKKHGYGRFIRVIGQGIKRIP